MELQLQPDPWAKPHPLLPPAKSKMGYQTSEYTAVVFRGTTFYRLC